MKTFGNFVKWFLYITVGILIVCGINYRIAGVKTVTVDVFGMILFSAFITTLVTFLTLPDEEDGKAKSCIKLVLRYIILCVIMSLLGRWFGWIQFDFPGIASMATDVGVVYLLTCVAYYIIDVRQADEINKMLHEKYEDEEL